MRTRCVLLLALLAVPRWAGKRIVVTSTMNGESRRSEIWIDGGRMRSDVQGLGTALFFSDNDRVRLIVIDRASNTYSVMDTKTLLDATSKLNETLKKLQESLQRTISSLPPEQRAEMDAMLNPKLPQVEYTARGERTVKTVRCTVYEMRMNGMLQQEVCTASPAALGLAPAEAAVFERLRKFGEESAQILKTLPMVSSMGSLFQVVGSLPIQTFYFENDRKVGEEVLESIEDAMFTDTDFSLGDAKERSLPTLP